MTYAVQAADLGIDCTNRGLRLPSRGVNAGIRIKIAAESGTELSELQFHGKWYCDGPTFDTYGIVFVPDPYWARTRR